MWRGRPLGFDVSSVALLLGLLGCSKDPPREQNHSGLVPPTHEAAQALDELPSTKEPGSLLTPLILAVTASALDGTGFGLAPSRNAGLKSPQQPPAAPRRLSLCPKQCPRVSVDGETCEAGKPILFAPARSPGTGITFEKKLRFDWGEGCVDEESRTFIAGRAEASFKLTGVGLLLSDNPDELDVQIETLVDVRYREDLSASMLGGARGVFAGKKSEDGKTFLGTGGLALDMSLTDPLALEHESSTWLLELDERISIEKYALKPDLVYTTRLEGKAILGSPSSGVVDARVQELVRSWGFRGEALDGCFDEPVSGVLTLEHSKGSAVDFEDGKCDCKAVAAGLATKTVEACKNSGGEILARAVRYLIQMEDFPIIGRTAP